MPPLPVYREVLECQGPLEMRVNKYESRTAVGHELLPVSTAYKLSIDDPRYQHITRDETRFSADYDASGRVERWTVEHKTDLSDMVTRNSGHEIRRARLNSGEYDDFYGDKRVGYKRVNDDGTIEVLNHTGLYRVTSETTSDGFTVYGILRDYEDVYSEKIKEVVDSEGKFVRSIREVKESIYAKPIKYNTHYTYDDSGRLSLETEEKTLADGAKKFLLTRYEYVSDNEIHITTTDSQGNEVRTERRYYGEDGELVRSEVDNMLERNGGIAKVVLRAEGSEAHNETQDVRQPADTETMAERDAIIAKLTPVLSEYFRKVVIGHVDTGAGDEGLRHNPKFPYPMSETVVELAKLLADTLSAED